MRVGNWNRLPRACARCCALLLLCILAASPLRLWAQDDDSEDDEDSGGPYATLTVNYNARGSADVRFNSFNLVKDFETVEASLERALHCPAGSLVHPAPSSELPRFLKSRPLKEQQQYEKYLELSRQGSLTGQCPAAMTRTSLLLSTDIPLSPIAAVLQQAGVKKFTVLLTYPKSKYSEQTPATRQPWDPDSADAPRTPRQEIYSQAYYVVDTGAAVPPQIHLAYGLRTRDAVRAAVLPTVFLLFPIAVCLWMRRAALRDAKTDPTAAWFSYFRVLSWCGNGLILVWMIGQTIRQGFEVIASSYTATQSFGAVMLQVAILILPPWLAFFVCTALSYKVYVQVRGDAWTRGEFIAIQTLTIASQFLPLAFFLAAVSMIAVNGQAAAALFAGIYVSYAGCRWLNSKLSGAQAEPLTTGDLRDRVFQLAKKAAVEVRQVFVVPAQKSRMANAFASGNRTVIFTDYLLSRMNKREVSAIAAHEIAHIQRKHPAWKMAAFIGLIFSSQILYGIFNALVGSLRHSLQLRQAAEGAAAATDLAAIVRIGDRILAFPELILVFFILGFFLYHLHSRYLEYVADAGAVQLTEDPEAMITALLKLSRLNLLPVQWDRATGSILTHPSTLKRVQHIATIGQVPPERLNQLLLDSSTTASPLAPDNVWSQEEQFLAVPSKNPVVTLRSFSSELNFKKWALRGSSLVPAACVAWAVAHYQTHHNIAAYILGGALSLTIYVAVGEWQATWFRARLKQKIVSRLAAEGIDIGASSAEIVKLSPHAAPRAYAMGFTWDTGCLIFANHRLCYVGDQIRFSLRPEQVLAVRLGQGVPCVFPEPRIYIDWQLDASTPVQTWNFLPQDPYKIWHSKLQSVEFEAKLQHWKAQPGSFADLPPALRDLAGPTVGEVTSQRLKAAITFGRFLKVLLFKLLLALIFCSVLKIPSLWFICLVELLATVYSFMAFWFFRDSQDPQRPATVAASLQPEQDPQTGD
jgi:Zn-dependent protease with chaperone function